MKKIQIYLNILFITFCLFIILNLLLGYFWELRTKLKFSNFKPYDNIVLEALNLNEEKSLILYKETFLERKFDYDQFTEHAENNGYNNQFVNVTPDLGRKTISPSDCKRNIFFYGGSTTFGYNVTDYQTIPSYLGEILIENQKSFCVKNYGRGSYFSTQETILLQKHLLNQKINEGDIVIFFDGINENGNRNSRNTAFLYNMQKALNQKYWDIYKFTFPIFFESLTTSQLIKRFKEKLRINQKTILEQNNIFDLDEDLKNVTPYKRDENMIGGCITIINSKFENISIDIPNNTCSKGLEILNSKGTIQDVIITRSILDGFDAEFSEILINKIFIQGAKGECIGVKRGEYKINEAILNNCLDHSVSVGEHATLDGNKLFANNNANGNGIMAKDSSKIMIHEYKNIGSKKCLLSIRKKENYDGALIKVKKDKFFCDATNRLSNDKYSMIEFF